MLIWLVTAITLILLALFLYWAIIVSEGSYFGSRFVVWLYDLSARRYDGIKQFNSEEEDWYLGLPLWRTIQTVRRPLVLDAATGTGRLPLALLRRPFFDGRVIGLDLSLKMLRLAREKLYPFGQAVTLAHQNIIHLPFPDDTFDAVTCLEAIEFLSDPERALREMVRVLRPGGVLLATNRVGWEARLLPGKALSPERLRSILDSLPLQTVEVRRWQVFYDQIWARKIGSPFSQGNGGLPLNDIFYCPRCSGSALASSVDIFECAACGNVYPVKDGIILLDKGR